MIPRLDPGDKLTINDLRDRFFVNEAGWFVYRRRNGSLGCQPQTKLGSENLAAAVKAGGRSLGGFHGVSRKEAIRVALARESRTKAA